MRLSIIIPVYNVEIYLPQCLDSVLAQEIQNFEVICVNDGSKDGSEMILEEYAAQYANLIVVNQENKGLSGARNSGLGIAKGEYVFFLDSDDFLMDSHSLHSALCFAESQKLDVCVYNVMINGTKKYVEGLSAIAGEVMTGEEYFTKSFQLMRDVVTPIWMHLYRREYLVENGFLFKPRLLHEDELFTPIVTYNAKRIAYRDVSVVHYRFNREGAITNKVSSKNFVDRLNTARDLFKHFSDIKANQAAFSLVFSMYCNVFCQIPKGLGCQELIYNATDTENMSRCVSTDYERKCYKLFKWFPSQLKKYRANTINPLLRKLINRFL